MAFLSGEGLAASLDHLLEELRRGRFAQRPRVVVTCDDASADFLEFAYPVLAQRGVPATVFVPTGMMGGPRGYWWNRLYQLGVAAAERGVNLGGCFRLVGIHSAPGATADSLWRDLRFLEETDRDKALVRCAEQLGVGGDSSPRPMTWEQIAVLDRSGLVTLGAHTVSHPPLGAVPEDRVRFELNESRDDLASYPSFRNVFAYPYGDRDAVTPGVRRAIGKAGYEAAFTTVPKTVRAGNDLTALGRVCVDDMDLGAFRWMIDRYLCR
jgi:peptidoglycan/xylan/chitin deacetylase (PgdA/CDA1 family)